MRSAKQKLKNSSRLKVDLSSLKKRVIVYISPVLMELLRKLPDNYFRQKWKFKLIEYVYGEQADSTW